MSETGPLVLQNISKQLCGDTGRVAPPAALLKGFGQLPECQVCAGQVESPRPGRPEAAPRGNRHSAEFEISCLLC